MSHSGKYCLNMKITHGQPWSWLVERRIVTTIVSMFESIPLASPIPFHYNLLGSGFPLNVGREFFNMPLEEKQKYANDPVTYEGYGSRIGVYKRALLDWGDYYFHHFLPPSIRNETKWPSKPENYR